jgi:hypothetical protein
LKLKGACDILDTDLYAIQGAALDKRTPLPTQMPFAATQSTPTSAPLGRMSGVFVIGKRAKSNDW